MVSRIVDLTPDAPVLVEQAAVLLLEAFRNRTRDWQDLDSARQEVFASRFRSNINAPVVALGGAAFSYFAGFERTPPRWMGRWGLEWLYRLGSDPRRMGFRYIAEPLLLIVLLGRRIIRFSGRDSIKFANRQ